MVSARYRFRRHVGMRSGVSHMRMDFAIARALRFAAGRNPAVVARPDMILRVPIVTLPVVPDRYSALSRRNISF